MFERFTDRARRVVVLAQEESRMLNHKKIGTEHLLLGLICEYEGVAAKTLKSLHFTHASMRDQVEQTVGRGDIPTPPGHIPFTFRAKKVLEFSLREALQLGHNYIGTEHILLGLIREGEGVAAQILKRSVEGGLDTVRSRIIAILNGVYPPPEPELPETKDPHTVTILVDPKTREFLERLSEKAGGGELALLDIIKAYFADGGPLDELQQRGGESIEG